MAKPIQVSRKAFEAFAGVRWNAMNNLCALSDIRDLTPIQRIAHLAYSYASEVENGGHYQYFANMADCDHHEVIRALEAVGAAEQAIILGDALAAIRLTPVETPETVEQYLEGETLASLTRYDEAFAACRRSVFECLENYLDQHEPEFIEWTP